MKKINTRGLVFEHFRNLGINSKEELEEKVRSAGANNAKISNTLHLDAINEGGLLVLLGGNNAGKSNVFEGLERFSNKSLKEEDKPDFDNYKGAPELTLTYCIADEQTLQAIEGKSKIINECKDNFTGKTYGIFFTAGSLDTATKNMNQNAGGGLLKVNPLQKINIVNLLSKSLEMMKYGQYMAII
ncbi:hypothetical protein [Helicobacter sp.]|uniref:hypothetical protein n=1 Tax=Helicobacter sp. TaxID=218 RepID=UPI0025BBAC05|nr:hypothetical protein [Helicobacter sp.]